MQSHLSHLSPFNSDINPIVFHETYDPILWAFCDSGMIVPCCKRPSDGMKIALLQDSISMKAMILWTLGYATQSKWMLECAMAKEGGGQEQIGRVKLDPGGIGMGLSPLLCLLSMYYAACTFLAQLHAIVWSGLGLGCTLWKLYVPLHY